MGNRANANDRAIISAGQPIFAGCSVEKYRPKLALRQNGH